MKKDREPTASRKLLKILGMVVLLSGLAGCAYFNTFYNARHFYREGMRKEEQKEGSGSGDFRKSLEKAVVVVRDYPETRWNDDAFFIIAMDYYRVGAYQKARSQFEGFLEHFPQSKYALEARFYHALTLVELEEYTQGRLKLQELFSSKEFEKEAMFQWALAHKKEEEWDQARQAFNRFLAEHPRGELAHKARLHLAEIELAWGDTLSAISTYQRYLRRAETSKENFERYLTLAELYYVKEDYRQAERILRKVRGKYPEVETESELLRAKIKLAQADTAKTTALLADIPGGEQRAEALFLLASIYEIQGEYELALAYYDTLTTRERRSAYADVGERKKALLEARVAKPDSADTVAIDPAKEQFLLAQTYCLSLGEHPRALAEYAKVVEEFPESAYSPKALYAMAWLRKYRLRDSTWIEDVERLLELYPESKPAKEARALLKNEDIPGDST